MQFHQWRVFSAHDYQIVVAKGVVIAIADGALQAR
jgi:hypothetical protein